jgi:hypothetical protein
MEALKKSITFISYSRKQLYFAEALALHLQNKDINIWFDLQQLQAGTEWSEGLKDGVRGAKQMVLVVSQAALDSPYTQDEWKGFVEKGNPLVLAIVEAVELPKELKGLPTYDFRGEFKKKLDELAAFLKAESEPRYDQISSPNQFGLATKMPRAIWLILFAQFGVFIALSLSLIMALFLNTEELLRQVNSASIGGGIKFFLAMVAFSLLVGLRYALPFLRHKLEYKKTKRSVLFNFLLMLPALIATGQIGLSDTASGSYIYLVNFGIMALLTLFVYAFFSRHSAGLLRWMQSEEELQNLRRRVHQPLVVISTFDIDIAIKRTGKEIRYTIHADPADKPFARWVIKIFKKAGHTQASTEENPEQHIALLSNRSSDAWVQEITSNYAGKLLFVVISTIEFKDSLKETGRYQWIDARGGDKPDIVGLARSLGDVDAWQREAAIEATPARINHWKVPDTISFLKRIMEIFAIYILVFGITDLVGFLLSFFGILNGEGGSIPKSITLVFIAIISFWLSSKSLVYRKVAAFPTYSIFGSGVLLAGWLGTVPLMRELSWLLIPLIFYTAWDSHFWLPASSKTNSDEVGIKETIAHAFRKRNIILISVWVLGILGFSLFIQITLG